MKNALRPDQTPRLLLMALLAPALLSFASATSCKRGTPFQGANASDDGAGGPPPSPESPTPSPSVGAQAEKTTTPEGTSPEGDGPASQVKPGTIALASKLREATICAPGADLDSEANKKALAAGNEQHVWFQPPGGKFPTVAAARAVMERLGSLRVPAGEYYYQICAGSGGQVLELWPIRASEKGQWVAALEGVKALTSYSFSPR